MFQIDYKNMRISIVKNKTKFPFIISDKPILSFSYDEEIKSGSLERNTFLVPYSHDTYLLIYNSDYFRRIERSFKLKSIDIHRINVLQWNQAHKFVYSSSQTYIREHHFDDEHNMDFKWEIEHKPKLLTKGNKKISSEFVYHEECYALDSCFLLKAKRH